MEAVFEKAFLETVKKHAGIKELIMRIMEHPVELGEPLKGNLRGFL